MLNLDRNIVIRLGIVIVIKVAYFFDNKFGIKFDNIFCILGFVF